MSCGLSGRGTTRVTVKPGEPLPRGDTDWARLDAMTDEEVMAAALSDPGAQPLTPEQLAKMRRLLADRAAQYRRLRQSGECFFIAPRRSNIAHRHRPGCATLEYAVAAECRGFARRTGAFTFLAVVNPSAAAEGANGIVHPRCPSSCWQRCLDAALRRGALTAIADRDLHCRIPGTPFERRCTICSIKLSICPRRGSLPEPKGCV
jgi:hypothetical protein